MENKDYSFIILTYNEEIHLKRLLESLKGLNAKIYILDSGSTDSTISIAQEFGVKVMFNKFVNHPQQWKKALEIFDINTPWTIGLDADQVITPSLFNKLAKFENSHISTKVNGIYFNRHNYFRGKRLKYGGYANKFLLKMFRTGIGYSDTNENMDHRFVVPGETLIWKDAILKEENLKENEINFWLEKHLKYSDLVAEEEIERRSKERGQTVMPNLFGNPDQRVAFYKSLWWKMPLYTRPFVYFIYRFVFKLGFMESKEGRIFHFLHAFWFRMIIDFKIENIDKR